MFLPFRPESMKKKKITRVSVRDIADAAGVSKSTVSFVLCNRTGPSKKTRERVLKIARRLGYAPDARVASWMATVRGARTKDLLPIAWLNTNAQRDAWHTYSFLSPFWEGARERCEQLGYRLDEIWARQPGMTMRRVSQILDQRGIEGVIVSPTAARVRLNWNKLAGVALGPELLAPRLHRVRIDLDFNLLVALKMLKRFGYQRIGICLTDAIDRHSNHMIRAMAHYLHATTRPSKPVPPLFYKGEGEGGGVPKKQIMPWVCSHRPDVIVGNDNRLEEWLREEGYDVPRKMGIVHLALDDDVLDWAGIHANKRKIGRVAAELVVSLVHSRQFGVPDVASDTIIRGSWQDGRTLLVPKLK